ncbi:PqqD family protein [Anaerocolumna chitinilytica]|uniref:PqqD family protein n=1 Tax=Anaerocolumna chitinilytica TaxID=1727145 RepID=A0A7I8DJ48_9FIRM|nr:PqqD family protein [Anaerocolumna chitinilytica]BCJ98342.1 hypothetical protein bsdcttw_13830 [Anaerocolumna chitinilytica]
MIKKAKGIEESYLNDEVVLFNIITGEFYGLQDTSYFIWEHIDNCSSVNELVEKVKGNYEYENETELIESIYQLINDLNKERLIEIDENI